MPIFNWFEFVLYDSFMMIIVEAVGGTAIEQHTHLIWPNEFNAQFPLHIHFIWDEIHRSRGDQIDSVQIRMCLCVCVCADFFFRSTNTQSLQATLKPPPNSNDRTHLFRPKSFMISNRPHHERVNLKFNT